MSARPFVFTNMAITADGKISSAYQEYPRFTSPLDRRTMDMLRAQADAVLIGAGTLRGDDPPMHVRDPEAQAARAAAGRSGPLLNIVASHSLNLPLDARFFHNPHTQALVVTGGDADVAPLRAAHIDVWQVGAHHLDWPRLLERLHDERGVQRLLVEGGGAVTWEFLKHDLLDAIHLTIAPALLGGKAAPTWIDGAGLPMADQKRLKLLEARVVGDEIYCHYQVLRQDSSG